MDPVAHTFTGAALAASGLRRVTPLATAALIMGANAPDVDALAYFAGEYQSLAFRRGWTHGVLALAVLPFAVTGLLLLWDRLVRRGRVNAEPARAPPLLGLSALAVLTHPTLDWLNNYGMRWLMPFDGRWFYGDALFIIDPWVWLGLGGALWLMHSRRPASLAAWSVFWAVSTLVVLGSGAVPWPARVVWATGLAALLAARALGFAAPAREPAVERAARAALFALCAYSGAATLANVPVERAVRAELDGVHVEQVMVGPVPGNPLAGDIVAVTPAAYHFGRWRWLGTPRLELDTAIVARPRGNALFEAAAETLEARRFLTWSRFPYVDVESAGGGHVVRFSDARYRSRDALGGPTVRLDADLEPVSVE